MKNVFSLLLLWMAAMPLSAQNEFLNKNNSLAPVGGINMGTPSSSPSVYTPNVFNKDKSTSTAPKSTIPEKEVKMTSEEFANPNLQNEKKLNDKIRKEGIGLTLDRQSFMRDMDMGKFQTTSKFITIFSRDYGEIDGDYIRAWQNNEVIDPAILLEGNYSKGLRIELAKGENVISMEALNVGYSFPNTAEFVVKDERGQIITTNMWQLDTGYKAIIRIVKL